MGNELKMPKNIITAKRIKMNHIDFIQHEANSFLNSVESRVHLERLHLMDISEAKKAIALYIAFIDLKQKDIDTLNNA